MINLSPNLVLVVALLCLFLSAYQVQQTQDVLTTTMLQTGEFYSTVSQRCESEFHQFCEQAQVVTSSLTDQNAILLQEQNTILKEPPARQLRSGYLYNSRHLNEETILDESSSSTSPFQCLEVAWMKHHVSLGCSTALYQLHNLQQLKHQQESNRKIALWIFGASWLLLFLSLGIVRDCMGGIFHWMYQNPEIMMDCFWKYFWIVFYTVGMWSLMGPSSLIWTAIVLSSISQVKKQDRSKENEASSTSNTPVDSMVPTTDHCACCGKSPSDSDDPLSEDCCVCCKGTGLCNTACDLCCNEECCRAVREASDTSDETEILLTPYTENKNE